MALAEWGWNAHWQAIWERAERSEGAFAARVTAEHRDRWDVMADAGARSGVMHPAKDRPTVGDWVVAEEGGAGGALQLTEILPRRTKFSRASPGKETEEQIVAANVDVVWVVQALDTPFNPRRLERYITLAWESGARPALVLTKVDLLEGDEGVHAGAIEDARRAHEASASELGVPVRTVSALRPETLEALSPDLDPGATVALLGPSGGGKSSLINALLGSAKLKVGAVREGDRKGRHTTTHRQLVRLGGGALLLDTPGMRGMHLWDVAEGLDRAFEDIVEIAQGCRYGDCAHDTEPSCAVKEAVREGRLEAGRLDSFRRLRVEGRPRSR